MVESVVARSKLEGYPNSFGFRVAVVDKSYETARALVEMYEILSRSDRSTVTDADLTVLKLVEQAVFRACPTAPAGVS